VTFVIPRFGYRVRVGAAAEQGQRRSILQDGFLLAEELGVFAIADGMGGKWRGDLASKTALEEVERAMASETTQRIASHYSRSPDLEARRHVLARLQRVVFRAHEAVRKLGQSQDPPCELGTTLDVVWLLRDEIFVAHVGDGRLYVVRANAVLQVTEDHLESVTKTFKRLTMKSDEHSLHRLCNALGLYETVNIDTLLLDVQNGDRLVLLTDGVWSVLEGESELEHWVRGVTAERAASQLVQHAKSKSFDDRTAVVIEIVDRFVRHQTSETDAKERDIGPVAESALFAGLPWSKVLIALSVAVYGEFNEGQKIAPFVAGDRVTYIVLDGVVRGADNKRLGRGATLYGECLVGCSPNYPDFVCEELVRTLRIRRDDFHEVCSADPVLAAALYYRLAEHLGTRLSH
jgi:protein phosphatase